jgi:hypothetical protein
MRREKEESTRVADEESAFAAAMRGSAGEAAWWGAVQVDVSGPIAWKAPGFNHWIYIM